MDQIDRKMVIGFLKNGRAQQRSIADELGISPQRTGVSPILCRNDNQSAK